MKILLAAALAVLSSPAFAGDCVFDGDCASRPAAAADAVDASGPAAAKHTRLDGLKKGASEGAQLGFFAGIAPAASLMSSGFDRRMSRAYDGSRSDNGGGAARWYGGMVLGVLLYVPALVLGGIGGLFGSIAGTAAPEKASRWNAERFLFD